MSHEPHADDVSPGSTPGQGAGADAELERQRAEGDMPGRPTTDPSHVADGEGGRGGRDEEGTPRVPPSQTVPDDVARDAVRDVDPANETGEGRDPAEPADPMQSGSSASEVSGVPREEQ